MNVVIKDLLNIWVDCVAVEKHEQNQQYLLSFLAPLLYGLSVVCVCVCSIEQWEQSWLDVLLEDSELRANT